MDASTEPRSQGGQTRERWLLFIHRLPAKPDYLRVKVARRLKKLGAISIKKTVYALPASDDAREDFEWLRREVEAEGASAVIAEAQFLAGISTAELAGRLSADKRGRAEGIRAAPDRVKTGMVWVTRSDVHVDRIASAWLIKRFIDKRARFKFVAGKEHQPKQGELRFDMYEAEYTHVGNDCSFQALVHRFDLRDRALNAIGEIVHDIDFKDDRFARPETAGTAAMIRAIAESIADDNRRIERGSVLFDDLYAFFSKPTSAKRRAR